MGRHVDRGAHKIRWSGGFGNGGQRLYVVPDLDLVVVITAGAYNDPEVGRTVRDVFRRIVFALRGQP